MFFTDGRERVRERVSVCALNVYLFHLNFKLFFFFLLFFSCSFIFCKDFIVQDVGGVVIVFLGKLHGGERGSYWLIPCLYHCMYTRFLK